MVVGIAGVTLALGFLYDETTAIVAGGSARFGQVIVVVAALAAAMSSTALVASLPESVRSRFRRRPRVVRSEPVYGFVTVLAVGIGSTLGSPLFILIPLNVEQYEFVSLGSLLAATVLSVLMAKVYADMYAASEKKGISLVGGPAFTRLATGTRSIRYFFSRVSMWIANTALAAYSKLVFVIFDVEILPGILAGYGLGGVGAQVVVYLIAVVFIGWSVINAVFEGRILKSVGYLQIILTAVMIVILVFHSVALGVAGGWNLSGILRSTSGNWLAALVINTGYLYLLFFGFQEIQALERDAHDQSRIPILSRIKKGYTIGKSRYLGVAMVLSVLIAAAINILYALAVYSVHPALAALNSSQIPALYLAKNYLGSFQELLMAIAFLLATITTFVPAFVAASRHLSALGEDGYVPHSVSSVSWVFTLAAIAILALGNANFLVEITDFLVLLSLGVITLSAIWMRRGLPVRGSTVLPLVVGASCFVAGAAIYFVDPSVAIFGVVAVAFTYLVFDVSELGVLGTNLFLMLFNLVCLALMAVFGGGSAVVGSVLGVLGVPAGSAAAILSYLLLAASVMLGVNVVVDAKVLGRLEMQASS